MHVGHIKGEVTNLYASGVTAGIREYFAAHGGLITSLAPAREGLPASSSSAGVDSPSSYGSEGEEQEEFFDAIASSQK